MAKKLAVVEGEKLEKKWEDFQFEDRVAYRVTFKHGTATEVQGHVMAQGIPFPLADIASIEPVDAVPAVAE